MSPAWNLMSAATSWRLGAHELLVEPAERRAAIAGDVAGGVEAGAPVALLLHQAGADQRLIAGDEDLDLALRSYLSSRLTGLSVVMCLNI